MDTKYQFSGEIFFNLNYKEIVKLKIEVVMAHLIKVNLGLIVLDDPTPVFFKRLFMLHSLIGIGCKYRHVSVSQNVDNVFK